MNGNCREHDHVASARRVDDILGQPPGQFDEADSLPDRDNLTYPNGYYAYCSALFVDIHDSSSLTSQYERPTLAKPCRSFISEMVAILNSDAYVREANIFGDCLWAVSSAPNTRDRRRVQPRVHGERPQALLNHKLKRGYNTELKLGIGLDYGRAMMIKAGYAGSGIKDVIYMGDVVDRAAHLAHKARRAWAAPIWVGELFGRNLNEHNRPPLRPGSSCDLGQYRTGSAVLTDMHDWLEGLPQEGAERASQGDPP